MKESFGIVIIAHEALAREFIATLTHVMGTDCAAEPVSIRVTDTRAEKLAEIKEAIKRADRGAGVVLVTDMFGGTPSNLALLSAREKLDRVLFGISMPALIKLTRSRHLAIDTAIELAIEAGQKYIGLCPLSKLGNGF